MARSAIPVIAIVVLLIGAFVGWNVLKTSEDASVDRAGSPSSEAASAVASADTSTVPSSPKSADESAPETAVAPSGDTALAAIPPEALESSVTPSEDTGLPNVGAAPSPSDPAPQSTDAPAAETVEPATNDGPRFDVVRVAADGQTVIAGTVNPNEEVEVLLDGEVVGTATADAEGAFVTVIFAALSGDAQQLQLRVPAPALSQAPIMEPAVSPATTIGGDTPGDYAPPPVSQSPGTDERAPVVAAAPTTAEAPSVPTGDEAVAVKTEIPVQTAPGLAAPAPTAPSVLPGGKTVPDPALSEIQPAAGTASTVLQETPEADESAVVQQPQDSDGTLPKTLKAPSSLDPASKPSDEASEEAPDVDTQLTALAPVQTEDETATGAPLPGSSSDTGDANRTVSALAAPQDTAATPEVSQNAARPTAGSVPSDQRFVVSTPVIILPAPESGAAPALVQPQADELAVLQPGGDVTAVTLDRISYGETGDVRMSGRGAPGRALRTYGNGLHLGSTQITGDGRWAMSLPREDVLQVKLFRFDEIGTGGDVTSRIETPFTYSSGPAQVLKEREVTIEKGDYLWRIAEQYYGEGLRYSLIYGANAELIRDPDLIYPGQVFSVPELVDAE
ncbi:MAG: LysM peptidoglycan-binding domain-containing protein [Pseudomonadota bacterium]